MINKKLKKVTFDEFQELLSVGEEPSRLSHVIGPTVNHPNSKSKPVAGSLEHLLEEFQQKLRLIKDANIEL